MDVWLFSGWGLIGAILLLLTLAYVTGRADGYREGRRDEGRERLFGEREGG